MYTLRLPRTPHELDALHDLRDAVLFRGRGKTTYRRDHPDDCRPDFLFMGLYDTTDTLCGTLRLDCHPDRAILRRVAIAPAKQNQGLGTIMLGQAHAMAVARGYRCIYVSAALPSISFYRKCGYEEVQAESPEECTSDKKANIPMQRML